VILTKAEKPHLEIETSEQALQKIQVVERGDTLKLEYTGEDTIITYHVAYTDIKEVELDGAIELEAAELSAEKFDIDASGAARINATLNVGELEVLGRGAAKFNLEGIARNQKINLEGACEYNAGSMDSEFVAVKGSGSVHVTLNVSKKIDADIAGATIVNYIGSPMISIKSSGASSLQKVG
jgi:hypothetical protein